MIQTLSRYLLRSFAVTFLLTLLVFTFVMSIGLIFKMTQFIAIGARPADILWIFLLKVPESLPLTIPMSIITSSLLVFGRLSADGEITAMRACGVSVWRIARAPLLFSVCCLLFCLYGHQSIAPRSHFARKNFVRNLKLDPLQLFEVGSFVQEFPGVTFRIGRREGHRVWDVIAYDFRNPKVRREIVAEGGEITISEDDRQVQFVLYNVTLDPLLGPGSGKGKVSTFRMEPIEMGRRRREYQKGIEDQSLTELYRLMSSIDRDHADLDEAGRGRLLMEYRIEFMKRLVLSSFCVTFAMFGIPLGIQSHRRESTIGIAMSLGIVVLSYVFIIAAEALSVSPEWRSDLIIWIPVLLSLVGGLLLFRRSE